MLAMVLAQVCALQKQYGKTDAELHTLVEGFSNMLSEYPMGTIIEAMKRYVKKNSDIPSPASIEDLINPPPPKLSVVVFIDIKKRWREGQYITPEEKAYCRAVEEQELAKLRGGTEEFRDAVKQIEASSKKTYDIGFEGDGWEGEIA